jgi:hypothetical protein
MMKWLRLLPFPLVALGVVLALPDVFPPKDFTEYWSAARVLAAGGDPYNGAELLPVQREALNHPQLDKAVSLWTPPWTLPLYAPLGWLPYTPARWVWLFVQLALVFASVELLWRTFGGAPKLWFVPQLVAFAFAPTFWTAHYGQNTGLLLLGLSGFLFFSNSRPTLAGCFAALTAVKPHLLAVVGVLIVLDVLRDRGWRVLLGGAGMLVVGSLLAVALNGHIFQHFVDAAARPATPETVPLKDWHVPLISYDIRHAIAPERFAVQFVPCAVACLFMAIHRLTRRAWEWAEQLPPAVLVSCLFAPYGGWMFDLVVLLVPAVQLVARARGMIGWVVVAGVVLLNVAAIRPLDLHQFGWYAVATGVLWVAGLLVPLSPGGEGLGVRGNALKSPPHP